MKYVAIAVMALALSGCGRFDRWRAAQTGAPSKTCVNGVLYLQFTSGASVAYDREGKVVSCGN